MVASDIIPVLTRPLLGDQRSVRLRMIIPAVCLVFVWWLTIWVLSATLWAALIVYAIIQLGLIFARRHPGLARYSKHVGRTAMVADLGFVLLLAASLLPSMDAAYPLAVVVGLRVFSIWRRLSLAALVPLVALLGYLVAAALVRYAPTITGFSAITNWWLLIAGVGLGSIAVGTSTRQRRQIQELQQVLRTERQGREARVSELERTANELRARMREQHLLEEGLRVITSSLSLDEVLHQIVDSTTQTLGRDRIVGTALALQVDGELIHHTSTRDGSDGRLWSEALARRTIEQGQPVSIHDAIDNPEFAAIDYRLRSAVSVPLFVGPGPARGALTVVSVEPAAFSSSHTRHLSAFAAQAEIAIANAELHSNMQKQQLLLEAVVRDINDGLVVVNSSSCVVLANPIGHQLLAESTESLSMQQRLLELAQDARASEQATIVAELKIRDEEQADELHPSERIYQAFASRIQQQEEQLVAIVLHDITHYRAEERARTDFISMVSHELRNPLHSLNGFLKVVIQGRAGGLSPVQQDFLQMADEQVETLKGRITELLEFNRIKAGRLTLKPKPNNLELLINGTMTRLALQAEQTNLTLHNHVQGPLPECVFDAERIGQVLTNLIENAIKATPAGGHITVSSQLRENEIWVSVSDTGMGIAPGDIGKIFKRFYRAHNQKSIYGSHLGLGLSICQQIVEGHGGRIWVESELNVGTTFSFALPLVAELVEAEIV